jgi:carboxypeptidase D
MGVNFSAILDGTAGIPSSIGNNKKPMHIEQVEAKPTTAPTPGKTPEQDKAMWEGTPQVYLSTYVTPDLFPPQSIL